MAKTPIITLDLNFLGRKQAIASYLIPHSSGVVLVECGPGSTLSGLQSALAEQGYTPADVTHVLLTHIHLDHAGAAAHQSGFCRRRRVGHGELPPTRCPVPFVGSRWTPLRSFTV